MGRHCPVPPRSAERVTLADGDISDERKGADIGRMVSDAAGPRDYLQGML